MLCLRVVALAQDALDGAGYTAIIANSDGDKDYERVIVQKMQARFVAGLIMATALTLVIVPVVYQTVERLMGAEA